MGIGSEVLLLLALPLTSFVSLAKSFSLSKPFSSSIKWHSWNLRSFLLALTFCAAFVMALYLKLPCTRDRLLFDPFEKSTFRIIDLYISKRQSTFLSYFECSNKTLLISFLDRIIIPKGFLGFLNPPPPLLVCVIGLIFYYFIFAFFSGWKCNKVSSYCSLYNLEDLVCVVFGVLLFIYSLMHQFRSLFVCGFLPSLPYYFAFSPSPFPPFQENGGVALLPPALPRFSATRVAQPVPLMLLIESWLLWMLHLPQDVILSVEIPGAVPCCQDDIPRNVLESLKKGNFRANRIN